MCENSKCCQKPDQLKGKPGECTPAQIKKCHGDVQKHPCQPAAESVEDNKK
jgi:hypothetical protein